MFKKMILLAIMAVAAIALAAPAIASANWSMETNPLAGNETVTFEGETRYEGPLGSWTCPESVAEVELEAGTSTGSVTGFSANTATCVVGGSLGAACTSSGLVGIQKTGSWGVSTNGSDITISGIDLDNYFAFTGHPGCPPIVTYEGSLTVTVDNPHAIGIVTLEGGLTTTAFNGVGFEDVGTSTISGEWEASPAGTYGIT
ncbi:MAG: hypothetical protein ACJ76D_09455 [Solirubrobacterales bacterium]